MLGAGQGQGHPLQKLRVPKRRPSGERGNEEEGVALLQDPRDFVGEWRKTGKMEGSSEPGLACSSRLLQIVTTTPAITGDFPENGEHGVPDSVGQSWDVIWCQPFCGHWGQHPDLTSPWAGVSTVRACLPRPVPTGWAQFVSSPATPLLHLTVLFPDPRQLPLCLTTATCSLRASCPKPSLNPSPGTAPFQPPMSRLSVSCCVTALYTQALFFLLRQ